MSIDEASICIEVYVLAYGGCVCARTYIYLYAAAAAICYRYFCVYMLSIRPHTMYTLRYGLWV